jgi:hypothetical protein
LILFISENGNLWQPPTRSYSKKTRKPKKPPTATPATIDLSQYESFDVLFVPTSKGGIRISFDEHHFMHHFTKKGLIHYRCINWDITECPAQLVLKSSRVYPIVELLHNHEYKAKIGIESIQ